MSIQIPSPKSIALLNPLYRRTIVSCGIAFLCTFNALFYLPFLGNWLAFVLCIMILSLGVGGYFRRFYTGISYKRTPDQNFRITRRGKSFLIPKENIVGVYETVPELYTQYTKVTRYATHTKNTLFIITTDSLCISITPKYPEKIIQGYKK